MHDDERGKSNLGFVCDYDACMYFSLYVEESVLVM